MFIISTEVTHLNQDLSGKHWVSALHLGTHIYQTLLLKVMLCVVVL